MLLDVDARAHEAEVPGHVEVPLQRHEIGLGETITCHPSVSVSLQEAYALSTERVVESGTLITSQGPGTSFEFALALVRRLRGPDVERQVAGPLILPA